MAGVDSKNPIIAGSGLLALDVIFGGPKEPVALPGGTCANVLLTLGEMGHTTMPLACLGQDQPGILINEEFRRVGAVMEGIRHDPSINTPIILQHWQSTANHGEEHSFSFHSPETGKRFPSYQTISNDLVDEMAPRLAGSAFFFFDRVSPAILNAAKLAKRGGAKIIFEPSSIGDPEMFQRAMEICHILKYSDRRLGEKMNSWMLSVSVPNVIIETKGRYGMMVILRGPYGVERIHLKALDAPRFIDSCGSGDTVTATLIHLLLTWRDDSHRAILEYLKHGQEMAAVNCGFLGARGAFLSLGWSSLACNNPLYTNDLRKMILNTNPFAGLEKGQPGHLFLS
ncbi:MAG: hypothetical protein G8345_19640 [Magnetococcales bacterium]|nr:hypothetical protein [Magnetococcales bacterium]NGZ29087.1 hypothetical protein [Magnetococcales bacterium]